jgi:hypothetical protein
MSGRRYSRQGVVCAVVAGGVGQSATVYDKESGGDGGQAQPKNPCSGGLTSGPGYGGRNCFTHDPGWLGAGQTSAPGQDQLAV